MPLCIVFLASGTSYIKHEMPLTAFRWSLSGSLERLCCEDEELLCQCVGLFSWGLHLTVHFSDFLSLVPS
jgi:hypothetical protein